MHSVKDHYATPVTAFIMTVSMFLTGPAPAPAQVADAPDHACELVDQATLSSPLPERFAGFEYHQESVAPAIGDAPRESITLNVLYRNADGEAVFITVSHFCPGRRDAESGASWKARVEHGDATETNYRGHTAYMQQEPAAGAVHIGEDLELGAHAASPGTQWSAIEEAVEMVRIAELEALAAPDRHQTAAPGDPTPAECSVDEAYQREVLESIGAGNAELWPWVHLISAEQAEDVELTDGRISDGRIAFPREGHPWLDCVQRNDILWSPLSSHAHRQFLRRVLEISEEDDRYVFQTRSAGLDEVFRSTGNRR